MKAVMDAEKEIGRTPKDVSATRGIGYDIEFMGKWGHEGKIDRNHQRAVYVLTCLMRAWAALGDNALSPDCQIARLPDSGFSVGMPLPIARLPEFGFFPL